MPGSKKGKTQHRKKNEDISVREAQAIVREARRISTKKGDFRVVNSARKEIAIGLRVSISNLTTYIPSTRQYVCTLGDVRKAVADRLGGTWPVCNAISLNKVSLFQESTAVSYSVKVTLYAKDGTASKPVPMYPPLQKDVRKLSSLDISFPEPFVCSTSDLDSVSVFSSVYDTWSAAVVSLTMLSDDI